MKSLAQTGVGTIFRVQSITYSARDSHTDTFHVNAWIDIGLFNKTFWPMKIITLQNFSTGGQAFGEALRLMFIKYIKIEEPGDPYFSSDYVFLHSKHDTLISDIKYIASCSFATVLTICIVLKYPLHT